MSSSSSRRHFLPLLDVRLAQENPALFQEQLRKACHKIGFFLVRHDIPIWREQLEETRRFFARPVSEKMMISYDDSPSFRGYMKLGVENTAGAVDLREQIEFASEDNPYTKDWPPYERLRGSNPWPSAYQPTLQSTTMTYVSHVRQIADLIRDALCSTLALDTRVIENLFGSSESAAEGEKPHWVVKLVAYPPVQSFDNPASLAESLGVGPHTDTNFLTIILQDTVGGLQVYSNGEWMDVPSDEGILVCNLGEQAEILSQGYFRATPHRVLPNNTETTRISVPFFYNPRLSATITPQPLPESLEWERPRGESDKDHWRMSHNTMLTTVGDNTFKSLARSHPTVFQRHHRDLLLLEDGSVIRREERT